MDKYIAVVHKDDDSSFGAYFPDLRGCFAAGDSEDEALANLQISLRMYAEDFLEAGNQLPAPRSLKAIFADEEVKADLADGNGVLVFVPLLFSDAKRRVNVMLEPSLIAAVDEAARISGTNRSDYLAKAAWREVKESTGAVRVQRSASAGRTSKAKKAARTKTQRVREYA
jgi:predicted RNase H-like HicB family nuclease